MKVTRQFDTSDLADGEFSPVVISIKVGKKAQSKFEALYDFAGVFLTHENEQYTKLAEKIDAGLTDMPTNFGDVITLKKRKQVERLGWMLEEYPFPDAHYEILSKFYGKVWAIAYESN